MQGRSHEFSCEDFPTHPPVVNQEQVERHDRLNTKMSWHGAADAHSTRAQRGFGRFGQL